MNIKNNIAQDFFSLVYGEEPQEANINTESLSPKEEIFAIILSYNNRNKNIFLNMPLFKEIFENIHIKHNEKNAKSLQKSVLDSLQSESNLETIYKIFEHLNTLKLEGIILYEEEQCIKTSFKHKIYELNGTLKKNTKTSTKIKKPNTFNIEESWFHQCIQDMQKLFSQIQDTSLMPQWLEDFINKQISSLKDAKFEITLCGIAKSGKSTLLNTLLYQEILPTSAIPESTNKITIIYSPKAKGEVKFFSQSQWEQLLQNLYFNNESSNIIKENQQIFDKYVESYITKEGLQTEIKLNEIKTYASNEQISKLSYLVKEITIYSPISLLKNNLVFINTPNINTKLNYKIQQTENSISNSIITLYLINASKPITQNDIEFLSDIIHYENLERVLIVFTRTDLVNLPDLKNLSQKILEGIQKSQNHSSKAIKKNISKIDFIPVSSTLALLHRTNRSDEALSRGYDLEDTGIIALEKYINDIVFKQPIKYSKNLILNVYMILQTAIKKTLDSIEKSNQKEKIPALEAKLKHIRKEVIALNEVMIKTIDTTILNSKIKIKDLDLNLKEHLLDFISYETSKNRYINTTKIENIIANNLKDSLKYLIEKTQEDFDKKMKTFLDNINKIYSSIQLDDFGLNLLKSYQNQIITDIKYQYTEGDLNLYTNELKKYINHILQDGAKIQDIQDNINKAFEINYKNIINHLEEKIQDKKIKLTQNITKMFSSLESIIKNDNDDIDDKPILEPKKIQNLKTIEQTILQKIKELKVFK
ncbi:dynamin family protein [Helicobacter sp. 13S00477-4]|uniref:dynamin family protein n=1 Tax=Helicobacter sp. 13S00477-4 TaxID=1905759 RepID=UPI000BA56F92|nr:dynamin family protein [Helicobacter sp. 13S00477-4]PAF50498.1 hypothetical protein BKH44_08055 [Helicobacter sp. 13S00477-4]